MVLILGMFAIALSSFPGLPICLRRQSNWTSLVRLSESIDGQWVSDHLDANTKRS